jgi:hypothetical protein
MVRSRNVWTLDAPAAQSPAAVPAMTDADAAVSGVACPNSGDANTSSRVV